MKEKVVRLNIEILESQHKYLKMCCARLGVTIKEFVTKAAIDRVDLFEDYLMRSLVKERAEKVDLRNF